jgi:hypothetical protein
VYAVGIVVTYNTIDNHAGCFLPIDGLLSRWGATLPTFASGAATAGLTAGASRPATLSRPATTSFAPPAGLPHVDLKDFAPAVGTAG